MRGVESVDHAASFVAQEVSVQPPATLTSWLAPAFADHADGDALLGPWGAFTYAELDEYASQVAALIRGLGIEMATPVAIEMLADYPWPAALLGVLRAGAMALPLDPNLSTDRLQQILDQGPVEHVLTVPERKDRFAGRRVLDPETRTRERSADLSVPPTSPALLLYPQREGAPIHGTVYSHQVLTTNLEQASRHLKVSQGERWMNWARPVSSATFLGLLTSLGQGATRVQQEPEDDPGRLLDGLVSHQIETCITQPALAARLARSCRQHGVPDALALRRLVVNGERISATLAEHLLKAFPGVELCLAEGVIEASFASTWRAISTSAEASACLADGGGSMLGAPLDGIRIDVLTTDLKPRPPWVLGEICITGEELATSWQGDSEVAQPPDWVRTGLLGRKLRNGVACLGRLEPEIEIEGVVLSLGEIEAAIENLPGIFESRVDLKGAHLVATWVPSGSDDGVELGAFRRALAEVLPASHVPGEWVSVPELPLDLDGRILRPDVSQIAESGLQAGEVGTSAQAESVEKAEGLPVETATTRILVQYVAELLHQESVRSEDHLLDLGANSVDIIRLSNFLLDQFGARLDPEEIFTSTSIVDLSQKVDKLRATDPAAKTPESGRSAGEKTAATRFEVLLDPEERETFKKRRLGLRRDLEDLLLPQLAGAEVDPEPYIQRSSFRRFRSEAVPAESFARWLSCLRPISLGERVKYRYPSAGGLYPVQTYLHVKSGRVEGLASGVYYYDPQAHALASLARRVELDRGLHDWVNRDLFDRSAFSLFLVGQRSAIEPMYGEGARDFMMYEAGGMGQLLMTEASSLGLGLCGVGGLQFEAVRHLFHLDEGHELLHSMVGGCLEPNALEAIGRGLTGEEFSREDEARIERMLEWVDGLSTQELQETLRQKRRHSREDEE